MFDIDEVINNNNIKVHSMQYSHICHIINNNNLIY